MTAGNNVTITSSGTLTNGTWLVIGQIGIGGSTVSGQMYQWIGDNSNAYANRKAESQMLVAAGNSYVTTISAVITGTGPFLLCGQSNASATLGAGTINCTRIA